MLSLVRDAGRTGKWSGVRPWAWFRIRPFWVTQGARRLPTSEGRILVGRVSYGGGGKPPLIKLAEAEVIPGPYVDIG